MATELWFDLADTARLAEHAASATEHEPSPSEDLDDETCTGALVWVADAGTYLMTSGIPGLYHDPNNERSNVVVYAEGWGPDSDRGLLGLTDVGHDDFAEHLHLTTDQPTLLDEFRAATAAGYRWFILIVDGNTVAIRFSRANAPDATG